MKLEEPVHFEEGNPDKDAKLFFVLASKNHEMHMQNMEKLANMLLTADIMDALMEVRDVEGLLELDAKYSDL